MSLLGTLQQGAGGLAAHRSASNIASTNLQNVNTPGYARQRADLVAVEGTPYRGSILGGGVHLRTVQQLRDAFIERQLPQARSDRYAAQGRADGSATAGNAAMVVARQMFNAIAERCSSHCFPVRARSG